jgi:hypothetical protein
VILLLLVPLLPVQLLLLLAVATLLLLVILAAMIAATNAAAYRSAIALKLVWPLVVAANPAAAKLLAAQLNPPAVATSFWIEFIDGGRVAYATANRTILPDCVC